VGDESFLRILARGKYFILLAAAIAVGLALLLTSREQKVYEGTALLQVNSPTNPTAAPDPLNAQQASQGLATTYATLIVDEGFLGVIAPQIDGGRFTAPRLKSKLKARAIPLTALIELKAHAESPAAARSIAGAVAAAFVKNVEQGFIDRMSEQQRQLQARISTLTAEIAKLQSAAPPGNISTRERIASLRRARSALTVQFASAVASGIQQGETVKLASPPTATTSPISPRPVLNGIAALLMGFVVGFALAWLRVRADRGVHTAEEAEQLVDAPLLASVPLLRRSRRTDSVLAEAFDLLHANLAFYSLERSLGVLTVSSYGQQEGKSTTVEGLACAVARAGMTVVAIDGDLRTRGLSMRLGHGDSPGLSHVLIGAANAADCLVDIAPRFALLPAGPTPTNVPSLLSSERMRALVEQLRAEEILILIDAPPVANLADAPVLASVSDGVVVVARIGVTERAHLRAVAADLRHTSIPIIGLVVLESRSVAFRYVRPHEDSDVAVGWSLRS
jgi:capsular exopolysaccharide synthesis family protein